MREILTRIEPVIGDDISKRWRRKTCGDDCGTGVESESCPQAGKGISFLRRGGKSLITIRPSTLHMTFRDSAFILFIPVKGVDELISLSAQRNSFRFRHKTTIGR